MAINSNNNNNRNSNKSPSNRGFSDFDSNYPSGFSRKSSEVSQNLVSASYLDAIKKNTQFNRETLKAIQTLEKNIDSIIFNNNKEFDEYIENLHKVIKEQKEVQKAIAQEKEQSDKKNKENLLLLLAQLEQLTGLNAQEIAKQLSDMNSEMFKKLPNEFKDSLKVLLKGNRNFINDVIQEYKERVEKEQKIELERKQQLKKFFNNYLEKTNEVFDKNSDVLKQAFLGPLNVLLSPLEEFFNFDTYDKLKGFLFGTKGRKGKDRKAGIFEKVGKKLFKKRPTVNDVAKTGDMGSLLINQTLQDISKTKNGKNNGEDFNLTDIFGPSFLSKILPIMLPTILSYLLPMLGIAGGVAVFSLLVSKMIEDTIERNEKKNEIVQDILKDNEKIETLKSKGIDVTDTNMLETAQAQKAIAEGKGYSVDLSTEGKLEAILGTGNESERNTLQAVIKDKSAYKSNVESKIGNPYTTKGLYWKKGPNPDEYYVSDGKGNEFQWFFDSDIQKGIVWSNAEGKAGFFSKGNRNDELFNFRINPDTNPTMQAQDAFDRYLDENKGQWVKFHTGGIIGAKDNFGSINNNYVIAQKGEVILPISESQYGLKTGILQPTVDGGIQLNKNIYKPTVDGGIQPNKNIYNSSNNYYDILNKEIQLNRNIPAISIEDINPITPTDYNMNFQNVNVSDLEKKLDVIISVLQNILKKDPVIIPENKQSSKDLELLIYGGAL